MNGRSPVEVVIKEGAALVKRKGGGGEWMCEDILGRGTERV